jgi:glyoxylase-like metal-dependent hydrolase (beta-lactamase superfamily II)
MIARLSRSGKEVEELRMKWGRWQLFSLHENIFWIDGGAMYGVVPRVIWEKLTPPDGRNRVALRANLLLISTGERNILVEAGLGDDIPSRWKEIYGLREPSQLVQQLDAIGFKPEDVDLVIPTHLHFDHCGGCVHLLNGTLQPRFPNAQHIVQRTEWQVAMHPDLRSKVSYRKELLAPIADHGLLRLVDGDEEIVPGVRVQATGGHTPGHQVVILSSDGQTAVYTGDLIPTTFHLKTAYVAGVDLYPLETMREKEALIEKAIQKRWLVFFGHDVDVDAGYLQRNVEGSVGVERAPTLS